jgi:hypothetical protein
VLGYDTFTRLFAEKYYPMEGEFEAAISNLRENHTKFTVFGRYDKPTDSFFTFSTAEVLKDKAYAENLDLFEEITEEMF